MHLLAVAALGACTATAGLSGAGEAVRPAARPAGAVVEHEATIVWQEDHPAFGGFSAVEVLDGGTRFLAVTDRGHWARGEMVREDGRLVDVRLTAIGPLLGLRGTPLGGWTADAEGMAIHPDGAIWLSFEGMHRVRRYPAIEGRAQAAPDHPDFDGLDRNAGLEALAIDAGGVIYAIPEAPEEPTGHFPVYRLRDGVWDRDLSLPQEGRYLITGADFGPDGRLYVVERMFTFLGFRTRVRRFPLRSEGFGAGETLVETGWMELDNMEGISVWEDAEGVVRITLLSDDNFFPLQRTLFAEYVVRW